MNTRRIKQIEVSLRRQQKTGTEAGFSLGDLVEASSSEHKV